MLLRDLHWKTRFLVLVSWNYSESSLFPEIPNFAEVSLDMEDARLRQIHVWCSRIEVARRLADKMQRAKQLYDHNKRTLNDVAWTKSLFDSERRPE